MNEILDKVFFDNTIQEYLIALIIFFALFGLFRFFRTFILQKVKKIVEKTKNKFDDVFVGLIEKISKFFYWFMAFFIAVKFLTVSDKLTNILDNLFLIVVVLEILSLASYVIDYFVVKISEKKDVASKAAFLAIGKLLKWILWVIAFLVVLSNLGVDVSALATGLGIGGIAVAFAFQSILKDLFSYFTILLDKPVRIGDYIKIGDKKGKVKNIGVKTTRLTGIDGEEVVVANDMITSTDFSNFGKLKYRRVVYNIGVGYDTPVKKLKKLKEEIIKIVESFDEVELQRCHLRHLNDSSMDYEVVYHIKPRDYQLYMDINEKINLDILELFEKEKVEIPFPTLTVYNRKG